MQLSARSANYLQSDLFGDAPKCGEMRPLAAILYAHLYAHLAAVQSTIAQFETVRAWPCEVEVPPPGAETAQ